MDLKKFRLNYATIKRRGIPGNYTYILTCHKYPVRAAGYEDLDFLKSVNSHLEYDPFGSYSVDEPSRFASSIARSRSKVLQLGSNNKWDFFVTLTISPDSVVDRFDLKNVVKSLLKFFDNYKQRRSSEFKYLVIPEKHKDGAFHFHGFFANIASSDLQTNEYGYLDFVPYCKKYGFCSLSLIKDIDACSNYVSKYISKDMFEGASPLPNTRLYYCSRGLSYDTLLSSGAVVPNLYFFTDASIISVDSDFCTRFFSKNLSSLDFMINKFTNIDTAPDLNNIDVDFLKKLAVINFCNINNIHIDCNFNYLRFYKVIRDDFVSSFLSDYDALKLYYKTLKDNVVKLDDDAAAAIESIFVQNCVNDLSIESASTPLVYEQLSLLHKIYDGDYNEIE